MIFFVVYAAALWIAVYMFRRRWQGYAVLALGLLGFAGIVLGLDYVMAVREAAALAEAGRVGRVRSNSLLHFMGAAYELLLLAVGLMVAAAPRTRAASRPCASCRYDLTGNVIGCCPECGRAVSHLSPAT